MPIHELHRRNHVCIAKDPNYANLCCICRLPLLNATYIWLSGSVVKESSGSILGWEDPLEEGMATPSNILAWRIPWTEEHGGLQSIESHRAGHNFSDLAGAIKVEQKFFF